MAEEIQKQHFVLVHGAGHGAWCWYKLRYHLQNSGHKVSCLDLAGAGIDPSDPNSLLSFRDYNEPLSHFLSSLPPNHKVVLVGHSSGGLSLTQALHEFGDKISLAIFVAATMLPFGILTEQDARDVVADLSEYGDVYEYNYGMGPDNPPTSVYFKKEFQRKILYQMSPEEDSILASMLLRPSSKIAFKTAKFSGGDVERVRRVYIKTMNDRMVKPEQQEAMIRKWPPSEVMTINTDHSPFFSAPEELCRLILKASNSSLAAK
ncbi:Carboxylesterase protein [Dioscorea alata]|uniref:Carboxylesterase protein n=1 Tax=Dioscorea alata TaxID=55571 RepID=A0ACB7UBE2_DIOAL|nr:Carboxylesterase protein [Dioscorea alata]